MRALRAMEDASADKTYFCLKVLNIAVLTPYRIGIIEGLRQSWDQEWKKVQEFVMF